MELREARQEDHEAVATFTRETWPDRESGDYIPEVYPEWIEGEDRHTLVVDAGDDIAGIVQCVLLSADEAWCQGMRVNPEFRGADVSKRLSYGAFDWARERGALVARNMVFSWNAVGLGQSRSVGFDPVTEFRWAHPEPNPDAEPVLETVADPAAAWRAWAEGDAREHLRGLALDADESWAVRELTRADLERAAEESSVLAVRDDGLRGMAYRSRTYEREQEGETERWAEYGVGSWEDLPAARALFAAIARDAAAVGADRTRVLIPETPRAVSDAAYARVGVADEPDFVLGADLTAARTRR
ncbi:GNAT family N-acetyltransferase [Halalkalicoccus sp. NIPERK01]|uniref:GNAT family N-acetyltransferase n=1 Tax=Halalkalicoccus sp. NIPERK01 TaxID=3053469 RepID=UPI00256F4BEA|nr:GNAT family N-acetyltransferase [Halalkalicoccus sp. NIPERK01]MDL5362696.1 GNAT family N-acetyltransferase [Halalkalicoccus sp. NIPERK01]